MPPNVKRRSFQDVLTDIDQGRLHDQLTAAVPKIIEAVKETNRGGSLSLTLNFKPDSKGRVNVSGKVSRKVPEPSLGSTIFYTDDVGYPHLSDPRQMDLKVVGIRDGKPQTAGGDNSGGGNTNDPAPTP